MSAACEHKLCGADNRPGRWPNGWVRLDTAGTGQPARWYCTLQHLIAAADPDLALTLDVGRQHRAHFARVQQRRMEGLKQLLREGRSVVWISANTGEPHALVAQALRELEQTAGAP